MKKLFCAAALATCAIAVGCSSSSDNPTTSGGEDAGGGSSEASTDGMLSIPQTDGSWSALEDVTFTGKGASDLGAIAITHGAGTIQFQGAPAQAFFFDSTSVPTGTGDGGDFSTSRDFEIIAAQENRLILAWITCTGSQLGFIYYESTDGLSSSSAKVPGGELPATGTCTVLENATSVPVSFPAITMPPPPLVTGFTITGSDLSFDGTHAGAATVQNEMFNMYPFNVVDCLTCANPGWYELHTLFYDPAQKACVGILYLTTGTPSKLELAYYFCLPSVTSPLTNDQEFFDSSWTSPQSP